MHKLQKGFTIIELVVVIAIIAILSAIVLISVNVYINNAKIAALQTNMHSLQNMAAGYIVNNPNNNVSGFCQSPDALTLAASIGKLGLVSTSLYGFFCYDQSQSNYTMGLAPTSDWIAYATPPTGLGYGDGNCSSSAWYATAYMSATSRWCVDSKGNSMNSMGNYTNCACQ